MKVWINGKEREVKEGTNLLSLLEELRVEVRPVGFAVAVNEEVVPKGNYKDYILKEGDRVEIVNIVGGG
ncbi:MAG: sulfur carrier protein ThiS [Aquificaceae bacterium]